MSLGPEQLKRIERGDAMVASGEVQISTTCVEEGPRCQGSPYQFNPRISARIVLASSADADAPSIPLSETKSLRCKQRRPNRNHHCTLALPNVATTISDLGTLPCDPQACYVNMLLGAANKRAGDNDLIVIGGDRPDGSVAQDKGRLNLVQAREEGQAPSELSSSDLVNASLPLTEGKKEKRRVVHSIPISAPVKGEVLAFDGSWTATVDQLPFNTFISTRGHRRRQPDRDRPERASPRSTVAVRRRRHREQRVQLHPGPERLRQSRARRVKAGAIRITQDVHRPGDRRARRPST